MPEDFHFHEIKTNALYNRIIQTLEQGVGEPLYPGDERRIFGEAFIPVLAALYNCIDDAARQKMLRYARGTVLDALGERFNTPRLQPERAQTVLRFSVSKPQAQNIIIPEGTRVTADSVRYFATDHPAVLQSKAFSVDITAHASIAGKECNGLKPGAINILVDLVPYIDRVSNLDETHGGADGEPYDIDGDNRYRERIRIAPSKWSTAGPDIAYAYWAMSADSRIIDVKAVTPAPSCVTVVPLLEGGVVPDSATLAKVLAVVNDPAVRPLTDKVTVEAPTMSEYNINLTYYTTPADEAAVIVNVEGTGGAIEQYNEWQQSKLGRNINPDQLRRMILAPGNGTPGAVRVEIRAPAFTELDETAFAKWSGVLSVNHSIVREG